MGQYWLSAVYTGRMLSPEAHARLRDVPAGWLTRLNDPRGRWVLHPPGCYKVVGQMDPIMEKHEVDRGQVALSELERAMGKDKVDAIRNLDTETERRLREYVTMASDGSSSDFGTYILQGSYWIGYGSNDLHVEHNIRVVRDD